MGSLNRRESLSSGLLSALSLPTAYVPACAAGEIPRSAGTVDESGSRHLSAAMTGPAQVQFNPDGELLVVTEKTTWFGLPEGPK